MTHVRAAWTRLTLVATLTTTALTAQCPRDWEHDDVGFGVVGIVHALAEWDPDGAGPAPTQVAVGGAFIQAGAMRARNLALWDPQAQQFLTLSVGTDGAIHAIAVDANNHLVIAGNFSKVDATAAQSIARWDGTAWHPYGAGIAGTVLALTLDASGELIAGGSFSSAGAVSTDNVARWDAGTGAWTALGAGLQQPASPSAAEVRTFAVMPNGDLIAGGVFEQSGSNTMNHMARWTGGNWVAHDTGLLFWDETIDLVAMPNGDLLATGDGGFVRVVILSNGQWTAATLDPGTPDSIVLTANNRIIASWSLSFRELVNGSWQSIGTIPYGYGSIDCMLPIPGAQPDDLILGGTTPSNGLMTFANGALILEPSFVAGRMFCLDAGSEGQLYAGGAFIAVEGLPAQNIAELRDGSWQALGNGLAGSVVDIVAMSKTSVFALSRPTGSQPYLVSHWDGATWQAVAGGPSNPANIIKTMDGNLLVGGDTLALFDGATWQTIPGATDIFHIYQLSNGDIAAGGFSDSIQNQARAGIWDGQNWTQTPGVNQVFDLCETGQGQLLLSGTFQNGSRLASWDGNTWQPIGGYSGFIYDLELLANGDVLIAGNLDLVGHSETGLALWDGQNWTPAHPELELPFGDGFTAISFFEVLADGSIAARTGYWTNHLPTLRSVCPPTRTDVGSGCPGSGGANRLDSLAWPLIGATYRATGTELPTTCFVLDAMGVATTNLALNTVLPTALPGCVLHVDPVLLGGGVTTNGIYRAELAIPSSIALIGRSFHQQLVPIEIDANGNLGDITATNAMTLTIGAF